MTTELVPAVRARRRARAALVVTLGVCAGLSVLGGHLMSPGVDHELGFPLILVAGLIMFVLPFLAQGHGVQLHEPGRRYLTARTFSGRRTVDLHRLARISRIRTEHVGFDMLILVDADGVRLMVDDHEVDRAMKQALSEHPSNAPRISRDAAYRLGLSEPPLNHRLWWFAGRFVAPFALLPVCFGPPLLLAWAAFELSMV